MSSRFLSPAIKEAADEKLLLLCYILKQKQGQGSDTGVYNIWEVSSAQRKLNILMYKLGKRILTVYIKCFPDE